MSVRDLIPWGRNNGNQIPSLLRDDDRDPFHSEVTDDRLHALRTAAPPPMPAHLGLLPPHHEKSETVQPIFAHVPQWAVPLRCRT